MTADAVGGVWQYATTLAAGLPRHGIEVVLAVLGPEPSAEQVAAVEAIAGVKLLRTGLPLDWLSEAATVRNAGLAITGLAREVRADIVHLNSPALAGHVALAQPLVAVAHGCLATWWDAARGNALDPAFRWHEEAMARGLRAADLAIAPSVSFAETLRRHYALPSLPAVIHNGRDFASPPRFTEPERAAMTVGRLWDEVKNAALLDQVAAQLPAPFLAAGAAVGPHGQSASLQHLQCLGHITEPELTTRLARRPVFVSAATFEPFGLAVLEAASAGCALVLSDIATFRELWDGAATFVPANDAAGFTAAIEGLLNLPDERARLGEAAQQRALRYSADRMTTAMVAHYRMIVSRRAAA